MNWYKSSGTWTRGDGDCFSAAVNLLLVRNFPKDQGDLLVHALVHGRGSASGHRFPHAWVETKEGVAMDHSEGKNIDMPKEIYYVLGNINPEEKGAYETYTLAQVRKKVTQYKHYGPWDLDVELQERPEGWEDNNDNEEWDEEEEE